MKRTIFHIDVNNAYLSWSAVERLRNGETLDLRTVPSIVGGAKEKRHGVVLAKSTPAKKLGIVTGEPVVMAYRKCSDLISVPPDMDLYAECSKKMFALLDNYSDRVEKYSVDEAFLDYTGMEGLLGDPLVCANKLKEDIKTKLGFTVNIGISTNKLLAKMAGELEKPDKVLTLYPEEIEEKMWGLPVGELFMVGRKSRNYLQKIGVHTIGELAHFPVELLEKELKSMGQLLHNYANGIDPTPVSLTEEQEDVKSIGNSTTLPYDVKKREEAHSVLLYLTESVSQRLRKKSMQCSEIAVSIKTNEFIVYSKQMKLSSAVDNSVAIYGFAKEIFDQLWKKEPIRLLGLRLGKLSEAVSGQVSLLEEEWDKAKKVDMAMDDIRKKFGKHSVGRWGIGQDSGFLEEEQ
ncbi:MAG: DNA polymerase IV [Bacillota bacterium]